jgi:putative oxidoreductase
MIDLKTAPYAALILRIALGSMFIAHALLKLLVFTPAGTVGFFQSLGLPGVIAYGTIAAELVGGLVLIAGIATRWVALGLIPVLAGSVILVHGSNGWLFSNEGGGWEYSVFLILASLSLALLGSGAYAVKSTWLRGDRSNSLAHG